MLNEKDYLRWITSAKRTLESARGDLERGDYAWACFKAQQAAEKALKALLWGLGRPYTGHSLPILLSSIEDAVGLRAPNEVREACIRLTKYYVIARYPDAWSEGIPEDYFSESEAREAIVWAEKIIAWVERTWELLRKGGEKDN